MSYIICDGNNHYLSHHHKLGLIVVGDISKARRWITLTKAENVLKNNCPTTETLKNFKWKIENISEEQINMQLCESNDSLIQPVSTTELNYDILDKVKKIHTFTKELETRKLYLMGEQRKIDLEIVDIEHAAEFYNLNASQGYKLYKLLHDARVKRRAIKDELQKIEYSLGTPIRSSDMENLKRSILGLDTRQYTPRINKELFGV